MNKEEILKIYKEAESNPTNFQAGDFILPRKEFDHLYEYFKNGARKITSVKEGASYAGGQFVYCNDDGFYGCAVYLVRFRISKASALDLLKRFIGVS